MDIAPVTYEINEDPPQEQLVKDAHGNVSVAHAQQSSCEISVSVKGVWTGAVKVYDDDTDAAVCADGERAVAYCVECS